MSSMNCDLCGKEAELHKDAMIEGSQMSVCRNCAKYGRIIEATEKIRPAAAITQAKLEEGVQTLVSNFGEFLKRKREQMGLTHKEFARKIAERESTLHKLETGTIALTIAKAKKSGENVWTQTNRRNSGRTRCSSDRENRDDPRRCDQDKDQKKATLRKPQLLIDKFEEAAGT